MDKCLVPYLSDFFFFLLSPIPLLFLPTQSIHLSIYLSTVIIFLSIIKGKTCTVERAQGTFQNTFTNIQFCASLGTAWARGTVKNGSIKPAKH